MSVSDSDIPSLSKEISAINATAIACADSCAKTALALFWRSLKICQLFSFRFNSLVHGREHGILREFKANKQLMIFSILLPGSLGGLPQQSWGRIFMKGEVDDLGWDVSALKRVSVYNRIIANDLKLLLDGDYSQKTPDLTQLILDPHSIPVKRPKDMSRLIKDCVAENLPGLTKNHWIHQIIGHDTAPQGEALLKSLSSCNPLYPQIMADLYAYSPAGVRDSLLARFTMTRTVVGITGNPDFISQITDGNIKLLKNVQARFVNAQRIVTHFRPVKSAFEYCQKLRCSRV